jgi:alkaline phosphatase D
VRRRAPDFFIHSGDTIYADGPLAESVALPDGTVWRNLVTPEKSKVAETLAEFRGNHRYNLLDEHVRRFHAEVPAFVQWDDHEVVNNWYPGELLEDPRYTVREVDLLAARARRAFLESYPLGEIPAGAERIYRSLRYGPSLELFFLDMRTYRGPNTANDQRERSRLTELLGRAQLEWLKRRLARSTATWKVIASDMPIGLVVPDGPGAFEAVAQGDGEARGRELEIAELLTFIRDRGIVNTVWVTADVHYTAAHRYDPERARYGEFDPFWEFVSGPLHAGTFGPNPLDDTFGPEVVFQRVPARANAAPSEGLQFFGEVAIAEGGGPMTVRLIDVAGDVLYAVSLDPR